MPEDRPTPAHPEPVEGPMKGLYGVQWRVWLFTFAVPVLIWFLPFPQPLRLLAFFLPPLFLATGFVVVAILKCPACGKRLMAQGLVVFPRKKCPHCRKVVA